MLSYNDSAIENSGGGNGGRGTQSLQKVLAAPHSYRKFFKLYSGRKALPKELGIKTYQPGIDCT